jgi:chemotaxis family two-component system response regulator PixG
MGNDQILEFNKLVKEFNNCTQLKYTGQLDIKNSQGKTWSFYYQLGQIVWVTGGIHPHRRWLRNITQYCPQIEINKIQYRAEDILIDYWDYLLLENLYLEQKIQQEQIKNIVENTILEVLFDLAQQTSSSFLSIDKKQEFPLKSTLTTTSSNLLIKRTQEYFYKWREAGLESISPCLAPVLQQAEQLQDQVSPLVYSNFQRLINSQNTFWDLSIKMNKNVLQISRSLLPYIQQGIIGLIELPDLPLPANNVNKISQFAEVSKSKPPLIACVDDSPQICKMLERIITSHGMRFIGVQDSVQALPMMIESKPDLIFLDLMMPVVNGYEVCNQLRRCSYFTKTPIVILTGSDGVFDRVRSKVFGATEFMTKPVETDKVMGMVYKYVQTDPRTANVSNFVFSY